ncbi:cytochrome P450 [Epithele typhae]|uniref:cytochrome P450 n=1 Tax=Epithele typhae TaxID=378194 RepID=UPI00200851D5|nr:cytochrome P450 [Epithele typhae]KAH9940844.1 cytochrome P450 [Epithele typhae]
MLNVYIPLTLTAGLALWALVFRRRSVFANIQGPPPSRRFLTGHLRKFLGRRGWEYQLELASGKYGQVVKIDGAFGNKWLYVVDPVALNHIILKGQNVYEESPLFLAINRLLFGPSVLSTVGDHHKQQRKLLNPVFSTNHMRHMLPIFYRITERLRDTLAEMTVDGPRTIDMLGWTTRAALEMVGQGGLGHSFDSLEADSTNAYAENMKSFAPTFFPMILVRQLLPQLINIGTPRIRRWIVEYTPHWRVQKLKRIIDSMHTVACSIFEGKKAAFAQGDDAVVQQIGEGKDIVSKLLQANFATSEKDRLPDEEVLAQLSALVLAAMDTTSSALGRTLRILAEHPEAQSRLRKEVTDALENADGGRLSYDELMGLPYLDAICRETLRVYPPLVGLGRVTLKDTILPVGTPLKGTDGSLISEIHVPKGTMIYFGILGSNRNPALWGPDAHEWKLYYYYYYHSIPMCHICACAYTAKNKLQKAHEWKPDRWLSPLPDAVMSAPIPGVYSHLMTSNGGGRSCIGFKFSQMEMKVVLSTLVRHFALEVPRDLPVPIVWSSAGIQSPSLGYESDKPELPLKIGLVKA